MFDKLFAEFFDALFSLRLLPIIKFNSCKILDSLWVRYIFDVPPEFLRSNVVDVLAIRYARALTPSYLYGLSLRL